MTDIIQIARKWLRKSDTGKALQLDAASLDLLNALGIGQIIAAKAANAAGEECRQAFLREVGLAWPTSSATVCVGSAVA